MNLSESWENCRDNNASLRRNRCSCPDAGVPCASNRCTGTGEDFGANPYVFDIEKATLENPYFRRAIWTGSLLQLTVMCISTCGETGVELNSAADQFVYIEKGAGRVSMGDSETALNYVREVEEGSAILIPAGTWFNLVNTGNEPIKLYSINAPSVYPVGVIQCTRADADAAET